MVAKHRENVKQYGSDPSSKYPSKTGTGKIDSGFLYNKGLLGSMNKEAVGFPFFPQSFGLIPRGYRILLAFSQMASRSLADHFFSATSNDESSMCTCIYPTSL